MFAMIKKLISFLLERKIDIYSYHKSVNILRNIKAVRLSKEIRKGYKNKWKKLGQRPSERHLKIYSSISGIPDVNYVPENFYYNKIEPFLNNKAYIIPYTDKNLFERLIHNFSDVFPKTNLRCINGAIYDSSYELKSNPNEIINNLKDKEYIVKPSSFTGGGRGVSILLKDGSKFELNNKQLHLSFLLEHLKRVYNNNFILQGKIIQHPWFSNFNKTSLNTVRILTYRSVVNENVHVINSVLRYGAADSIVDNQASGGCSIGVDAQGLLNMFAVNKQGIKILGIPVSDNEVVPEFGRMQSMAKKIAPYFFFQRLLGFDFCLTNENEIKILEVNCKNLEINFHQMNNGPLFGDYTDEIIEYCRDAVKTITFNFRL